MMQFFKAGSAGVVNQANTLWRVGQQPSAGAAGSAAPGGRSPTNATAGALPIVNPSSGTLHLTGADVVASVVSNSLLIYDRIFDVAKTMNSTATEAVTGVPSRYQNTTPGTPDYVGGNFCFPEVGGTALANTAHNWTVCTYKDQADAASTFPSVAGVAQQAVDRMDLPTGQAYWFMPLEAGDSGVKALTQMQCSAAVATGAINFVIGHPIGMLTFPVANVVVPHDWLTSRQLAPRIYADAALTFLEMPKPTTTATTYSGLLHLCRAD